MKFARETAAARGGISSFLCWGKESELERLDRAAGRRRRCAVGELGVALLQSAESGVVDEIMLGCPAPGFRLITCHGGIAISAAVSEALRKMLGAEEVEASCAPPCLGGDDFAEECDRLLASCFTSTQAALILRARQGLAEKMQEIAAASTPEAKIAIIDSLLCAWPKAQALLRVWRLCLVGPRNSGKSALFNLLLGEPRALVSDQAGTTRDALEEWCDLAGYAVLLVDTAGLGNEGDALEAAAAEQSLYQAQSADIVAVVLDAGRPLNRQKAEIQPLIALHERSASNSPTAWLIVINKIDSCPQWSSEEAEALFPGMPIVAISCLDQAAVLPLRQRLVQMWGGLWQGEIAPVSAQQVARLIAMRR
ncbi:MAG: 50S ribosome-binding GTPase, partial [Planctomycetota bacterium]|nr:50S ribosome-binding GTPase [Planctomycetota bacterium]